MINAFVPILALLSVVFLKHKPVFLVVPDMGLHTYKVNLPPKQPMPEVRSLNSLCILFVLASLSLLSASLLSLELKQSDILVLLVLVLR